MYGMYKNYLTTNPTTTRYISPLHLRHCGKLTKEIDKSASVKLITFLHLDLETIVLLKQSF